MRRIGVTITVWAAILASAILASAVHDVSRVVENHRAMLRREVWATKTNLEASDALVLRMRSYCAAKSRFVDWVDCHHITIEMEKIADSERSLAEEVKERADEK